MWAEKRQCEIDSLSKEFIENSLKAADESDANKMRELLVKGRRMRQEAEKGKKEVAELESAIVALKKKRNSM